ncbi:hypothetical protein BT96DRAFT_1100548, partial [Gymnopus androsaceus JB14]
MEVRSVHSLGCVVIRARFSLILYLNHLRFSVFFSTIQTSLERQWSFALILHNTIVLWLSHLLVYKLMSMSIILVGVNLYFVFMVNFRHWSGTLLPYQNSAPSYAQLYILDPYAAQVHRMNRNENLDAHVMQQLQDMLIQHNIYVPIYKSAWEILQEHQNTPNYSVRLRLLPGFDRRRYNEATADEIAVLVPGDETIPTDKRDIVLRLRTPNGHYPLQRVWDTHASYAPLHYVLLFPYGEAGWDFNLHLHEPEKQRPSRLTLTRYVSYRIHSRSNEYSTILHGGRLFQRYIVDMWAAADQQRLTYLRTHQQELRAELYQGLADALDQADVNNPDSVDLNSIGRRIILPSSYIGGARYMHQRFQDAMAAVRHFKKIDLFITVTANP